jgi:hypothetical protein
MMGSIGPGQVPGGAEAGPGAGEQLALAPDPAADLDQEFLAETPLAGQGGGAGGACPSGGANPLQTNEAGRAISRHHSASA